MKTVKLVVTHSAASRVTPARWLARFYLEVQRRVNKATTVYPAPPLARCEVKACPYQAAVVINAQMLCRHHARMLREPHMFRSHAENQPLSGSVRVAGHYPPAP